MCIEEYCQKTEVFCFNFFYFKIISGLQKLREQCKTSLNPFTQIPRFLTFYHICHILCTGKKILNSLRVDCIYGALLYLSMHFLRSTMFP